MPGESVTRALEFFARDPARLAHRRGDFEAGAGFDTSSSKGASKSLGVAGVVLGGLALLLVGAALATRCRPLA